MKPMYAAMSPCLQSCLPTADFTFDMSSSWLMSVSRLFPCRSITTPMSRVLSGSCVSLAMSRLIPSITVSGVRSSCVMLVKNVSRIPLIFFSTRCVRALALRT